MGMRDLVEATTGYGGLFWLCALSGIAVPVPEDVPLLYAGIRIEAGSLAWAPTLGVALSGVLVRDLAAYAIGRYVGAWLLRSSLVIRLVGQSRLDRARRLIEDHGSRAVLAGRFMIGLRAPLFMVAGAMGTRVTRFLLWDVLGLLVAVPGMVVLGYVFGAPLIDLALWFMRSSRWAAGVAVVGLLASAADRPDDDRTG